MKNFFKKLSFVLALAMVLTSIAPATASAATKNYIAKKGSKQASTVYVFIGGSECDLDYSDASVKGTWKSADESIAKVDKNGVVKPVANGKVKISFVSKDGKTLAKQTVRVCTRAVKLNAYDGDVKVNGATVDMKVGESKDIKVTMPLSAAKIAAGAKKSSYASYCTAISDEAVVAVKKVNDRKYTLEAKAAGEATVTIAANQTSQANVYKGTKFVEVKFTVKVAEEFGIVDATATKVTEIQVTFGSAQDTDDVVVSVAKGSNAVAHKVTWNAEKTVATITTTAKMTNGTYTVTATSKKDETAKSSKPVEIVSQYVAEIQILNEVALTGKKTVGGKLTDAMEAYAYYKVLDQYGEDLTASTSIQWSTSCDAPVVDRAEGKLTLSRTDEKAFTYGEQIYITGVYSKTGKSVQATLTVGGAQAVDTIKMAGFVKKNTNTIVSTLPEGFKSDTYYLVFDAVDQNGNAMPAENYVTKDEVTFINDNVMLISEIKAGTVDTMVIDGHAYKAVLVTPGQFVNKGGEVNITAIATKTGNKTTMNYVVGANHILTSFTMQDPTDIVADGECVAIPFTALDQNGLEITNFAVLANNLNTLTFSASVGTATLAEQKDGTAKLVFQDEAMPWNDSRSTDGIDRNISITSVVVGGNSDNLMVYVVDKARPDAISKVGVPSVMLEGATGKIGQGLFENNLTFLDQYGREMGKQPWNNDEGTHDNGFFAATKSGGVYGREFNGYAYNVVVEFKGNANALSTFAAIHTATTNAAGISGVSPAAVLDLANNGSLTYTADAKTKTALSGNYFNFYIARTAKDDIAKVDTYEAVSSVYNHAFTVVDVTQLRGFTVADMKTQYVPTDATGKDTGILAGIKAQAPDLVDANGNKSVSANAIELPDGYTQSVSVKASYNGVSVNVPADYYTVEGTKLMVNSGVAALGENEITEASGVAIEWKHLYDASTAQFTRKNADDTLKVKIYEVFSNEQNGQEKIGKLLTLNAPLTTQAAIVKDTVSKKVVISDAKPVACVINVPETVTVCPTNTSMAAVTIFNQIEDANHFDLWYGHPFGIGPCIIEDQYGVSQLGNCMVTYKVSQIVENPDGVAENNFSVTGNDTPTVFINGAERGDTFVLTITVNGWCSKDVTVVVGADENSKLDNNGNTYTSTLYPILNDQRKETLK